MTINNKETYLNNIWDWGCLNGCFGETKIAPTDIDGFVERNGKYLVIETKSPGVKINDGQEIAFRSMINDKLHTVVIVWGPKNLPQEIEVRTSQTIRHYEKAGIEKLRWIVSKWFKWADNQKSVPEFEK